MKYFDINTPVKPKQLRYVRKHLHDIQVIPKGAFRVNTVNISRVIEQMSQKLLTTPPPPIANGLAGEFMGFKMYVSDTVPEGSLYFGPVRNWWDRLRYRIGI